MAQQQPTFAKTALITGSTGGIGSELATRLHGLAYRLLLVDMDDARLKAQAGKLAGAEIHVVDMRDGAAVAAFCKRVIAGGTSIDVAVINAGMLVIGDLANITPEDLRAQITVNLCSAAALAQALAGRMREERRGHSLATVG